MSLFRKKPAAVVQEFGYQDAVDYLRDLEQADYTKILKVVKTYREADKTVKKILNIKDAPLDEDADIADLMLEDELPKPVKVTHIKVSNAPKAKGKKK